MRRAQYLILLICVLPVQLFAEFIKTRPLVYQSRSGQAQVIISQDMPGIFIRYGEPVDLQEFDPSNLKSKSSQALFIHYSSEPSRYVRLQVGQREYTLNGIAAVSVGNLKITIDNANPYLAITDESDIKLPAVLAFHGLREAINSSGDEAVALLEANQLNEYRDLIKPLVMKDQSLQLNKTFYEGDSIGIDLNINNPCLLQNTKAGSVVWIEETTLQSALNDLPERRKDSLKKVLLAAKNKNYAGDSLRLSVNKKQILLLNYKIPKLYTVNKREELSSNTVSVCVLNEITNKTR